MSLEEQGGRATSLVEQGGRATSKVVQGGWKMVLVGLEAQRLPPGGGSEVQGEARGGVMSSLKSEG